MGIEGLQPDEVLAMRFDGPSVADELAAWCGGHAEHTLTDELTPGSTVWVPTLRGPRPAVPGDWIVRHGEDEHEVLDGPTFAARHQALR